MASNALQIPRPLANQIQWSDWVVPNGGIDESRSDHDLPPEKWVSGVDVEPLPSGCRARFGKTKINATPIPGSEAITGILDYRLSDGVTERLLVVSGTEVYKEVGGVMTAVSPGAGTFTADADNHPAMNVGNDTAYISNGVEVPQRFFIRSGTEYWANDGIAAPTVTPVVAGAAGGTLTVTPNGVWAVDYYYWDEVTQTKSNTRYQGANTLTVTLTANQKIVITGLPATVERAGDRATHIRISLKAPASGLFRFAGVLQGQVALGVTTAEITQDLMTNEPDYDDDAALVHSIATVGANQRFIAGIAATPWRVMASKVNIVGSYYESFPSLNYRDFGKGDGDYVTALAFIAPATLIVGMKNSLWALDARRFLTSDPVLISKNVGIAGKNAFMVIGRALFFVSDSERMKGMMMWDGQQVRPLTAVDKTFKSLIPGRIKYATCGHLAPGDDRFQWWTLITASGSSQNRVLMYDYSLDSWSVYRHSGNVLGTVAKGSGLSRIKIGDTSGTLYDADTGITDDGTAVLGTFTAKRMDYGAPDAPKRVRFIRAEGEGSTNSSLEVQFEQDQQGYPSFSGRLNFDRADGSYLGAGVLGTFILSGSAPVISTRTGLVGVARNLQPTFYADSRWHLRGYSLGVQTLRRR
jgi:hypothetical protein